MEFDVGHVLRALVRFWWLLLIGAIAMGTVAFTASSYQTPMYRAQVTIQVNPIQTGSIMDFNSLMYAERLTQTFQRLVKVRPLLEPVIADLDLPYTPDELAGNVSALAESDSQLLLIQVSDPDPERAAQIANTLAASFKTYIESESWVSGGGTMPSAQLLIRENAVVPAAPYAPRTTLNVAIGVATGLALASVLALALVYLDSTVKSTTDVARLGAGPLLASIRKLPNVTRGRGQLYLADQPTVDASEAIRLLRTNLEFASAAKVISTLALSSANTGEGKSTVASNLAVALAQAGFETAIVDADLRKPQMHQIFQVDNSRGLSTMLMREHESWSDNARRSHFPGLTVIPSGPLPPNAADLLSLSRLQDVLDTLKSVFDIVIIDTPPINPVSDALIVAGHTDGLILVCRSGRTRIDALQRIAAQVQRGAIRTVGVVVNLEQRRSAKEDYYVEAGSREPGFRPVARLAWFRSRSLVQRRRPEGQLPAQIFHGH